MIENKQKKIKKNSIVEIITLNSIRVIGLVNYNKNNIIELADPCIIEVKKSKNEKDNTLQIITDMLPQRITGSENFAKFNYNDLASISRVVSETYISLQDKNVDEYAKMYMNSM